MRTHTKTFHIRFTEKEYNRLCKYAEKAGLPKTTYIRHMINGCCPQERPDMDYYQFMQALYRLGNNLNQVTHLAHKFGSLQTGKLEQLRNQHIDLIRIITKRMILPEKLDIPTILERGQHLTETEQKKEKNHAKKND
jgi:predicted DNA-binding protein